MSVLKKIEAANRGGLIENRTVLPRYFGGALKISAVIRITASVPSLRCQCTVVPGSPVVSPGLKVCEVPSSRMTVSVPCKKYHGRPILVIVQADGTARLDRQQPQAELPSG